MTTPRPTLLSLSKIAPSKLFCNKEIQELSMRVLVELGVQVQSLGGLKIPVFILLLIPTIGRG